MSSQFRQVALIGKYHAAASGPGAGSTRATLEDIAQFLVTQGCDVVVERATAGPDVTWPDGWEPWPSRRYGDTRIELARWQSG